MPPVPQELIDALESGEITRDQLVTLITLEAEGLGLSFDHAIELAKAGKLPKSPLGQDLAYLVKMLDVTPVDA